MAQIVQDAEGMYRIPRHQPTAEVEEQTLKKISAETREKNISIRFRGQNFGLKA